MTDISRVSKWALFVWAVATLSYAVAVINRTSFASLGPTAQDHFGVEATVLGSFSVMQLILYAAMQVPVGILVQRFGPTRVILIGAVFMTAGQALTGLANDVWVVIFARLLVGIGDAGTFISVLRMLALWFPLRQLPIWTQVTSQLGQLGQIAAVIPLAMVVTGVGWMPGFVSTAMLTLAVAVVGFFVLSDGRESRSLVRSFGQVAAEPVERPSVFRDMFAQFRAIPELLRLPGIRLAYWIHFTSPFSVSVFVMLWGYPFLMGGVGLSETQAAGLVSLSVIIGIGFGMLIGPLSARFHGYRVHMVGTVIVLSALAWAVVLLWPDRPPVWLLSVLMVIIAAGGPMSMTSFDVLRDHAPIKRIGVATGFVNTGGFVAAIVLIFVIGLLLDLQGAGNPETYSMPAFRVAMSAQYGLWALGLTAMIVEYRKIKRLDAVE